jgi:hypothetical protein
LPSGVFGQLIGHHASDNAHLPWLFSARLVVIGSYFGSALWGHGVLYTVFSYGPISALLDGANHCLTSLVDLHVL